MGTTNPNELRQKFLEFFESKKHLVHAPASLKGDDPTLLFNVAGMQQFKAYFQGATPKFPGYEGLWPRVVTAQRCMRAGGKDSDIENIGRTRRHHTMFEMLGNFSFGDYFKREAAQWAWEFFTSSQWLGLDPERLYVTVYNDDDEAYDIWLNEVRIPADHLSRFGEDENFWPANAIKDDRSGPCGPCSEIFYDRGPEFGSADETGPNTGMGDRYMEIWNLVFTQFNLEDGVLTPLPQKNIDTGMGFERLVTIVSGATDAYATELFQPTIRKLVELTEHPYQDIESVHHRIIADHIRSVTFAVADGILPANDGAGYVIKMLIRRASRQAYLLGMREPLLYKLVACVVEAMGEDYPHVADAQVQVERIVKLEEEQFLRTLESGINRVNTLLDSLGGNTLDGETAFDLWQTYGFPLDLTQDIADERGVTVDKKGYEAARERARQLSRSGTEKGDMFGGAGILTDLAAEQGETEFVGYTQTEAESTVIALIKNGALAEDVAEGGSVQVLLDKTPFYAEGGGQVSDAGKLEWQDGAALVSATTKSSQGLFVHQARVIKGTLSKGQTLTARVDPSRSETQKHHSATHLLHEALRTVLGKHVAQAGSLVTPERLRFDFTHNEAITTDELEHIEILVNRWIQADFAVNWEIVSLEEARKSGAMMLFGEKYGERVRMVTMGDPATTVISAELCGGTHVNRTGEMGSLYVVSEESVSSGVRRVEAVTGQAAVAYAQSLRDISGHAASLLGTKPEGLSERIEKLQADLKAGQREVSTLRDQLAAAQTSGGTVSETQEAGGFSYVTTVLEGLDATALRNAADNLLNKSGADIVVLASGQLLVTKASKDAQAKGAHAGNIIREVAQRAGGGGGGRPDMAQAGVKDTSKVQDALAAMPEILEGVAS